ncbi:hypothetical protein B0T14DRAFT_596220 [Immersiella caudata]|uniref:Uncharacterized protein n=1 Tax=Immersiella caudata TaxID=314043 RepID=A0AA39T0I8_9PEZI|nr:hypothetical protein B0T14DRAFT_596220 [Immersiella caudata]
MASNCDLGPLPKRITGGWLCGKMHYEANFPPSHPFTENVSSLFPLPLFASLTPLQSGTSQPTQRRRSTSHLFFMWHNVPHAEFPWTTPTETLKNYHLRQLRDPSLLAA